jgi:Ser/Thr protein kinase RdoA (MazF antagonist)
MDRWIDTHMGERMPEKFFVDLFAAFMVAGQYMLDHTMVHNDLKPWNILLDVDVAKDDQAIKCENLAAPCCIRPVVIDFGGKLSFITCLCRMIRTR